MKTYSLSVHWKQGDEFAEYLDRNKDDVSKALFEWASNMHDKAQRLEELARLLKGEDVEADADTHCIMLYGDEKVLDKAAEDGFLSPEEILDDDE